jgi:hypothetical protein
MCIRRSSLPPIANGERLVPQDAPIAIPTIDEAKKARLPSSIAESLTADAMQLLGILGSAAPDLLRIIKQARGEKLFHVVMKGRTEDPKEAGGGLLHAWSQTPGGKFQEQALLAKPPRAIAIAY